MQAGIDEQYRGTQPGDQGAEDAPAPEGATDRAAGAPADEGAVEAGGDLTGALSAAIAECLHAQAQVKAWGQVVEELKATIRPLVEMEAGPGFSVETFPTGSVRHKEYDEAHVSAIEFMASVSDLAARGRFKSAADAAKLLGIVKNVHKDFIEILQPLEEAPKRGAS